MFFRYKAELERVKNTKEFIEDQSQYNGLFKKLTTFTGRKVTDTEFIYYLYHTLTAETSMNLTLPEWTHSYFPHGLIADAARFEYGVQSYNPTLTKLNGGESNIVFHSIGYFKFILFARMGFI